MWVEGERHEALAVEAARLLQLKRDEHILLVRALEQPRLGHPEERKTDAVQHLRRGR